MITENQNSIILRGDCWSNNLLFKYNETREPVDMRLVDLQLMYYGNPASDLSYCLYSSSLKDVFNHLDDYLSIYHRSLSDTVRKLGSDPERVLTLENLKKDWRQYAKFGFILGTLLMQNKMKSNDSDLSDVDFGKDAHFKNNFDMEKYCSNLMDIIVHLDKYGVFERDDILKCLEKVSKTYNFDNYKIDTVEANQKGEGYVGQIFLVTISDTGNPRKKLDLAIKSAFKDAVIRQNVPIRESFENEIYAYSTVFPRLKRFLKSKNPNIDLDDYKFVPKCYHVSIEDGSEVLVLENLRSRGFELFDKNQILDGEHIRLIFETYGRFHGISLVYKDQLPEDFQQVCGELRDVYSDFLRLTNFSLNLTYTAEVAGRFIATKDAELYKKFQKYETKTQDLLEETLTSNDRNSVILHGDCWSNNMMFKYKTADKSVKKLIDIRLLDLQLVKTGNPVCDLSYCLYSGASKEVFDKLDDYLLIYHRSLSEIVSKLGSDPDKLLRLEDLQNDWRKYAKFGFLLAMFVMKIKLTKPEDVVDLTDGLGFKDNTAFIDAKFDEETFGVKMFDIARHLDEYGAL